MKNAEVISPESPSPRQHVARAGTNEKGLWMSQVYMAAAARMGRKALRRK
jgi:hypothetical protein